jgi:hypothetical protein
MGYVGKGWKRTQACKDAIGAAKRAWWEEWRAALPANHAEVLAAARAARGYRKAQTLRNYGITRAQLEALVAAQNGRCAVCARPLPATRYHIDHDHSCCPGNAASCGRCVRGILCGPCNTGLGQFGDSVDRLRGAIRYLEVDRGHARP